MLLIKKRKYEEEIKTLQKEKYDALLKEIEILQQIACKFDSHIKKCASKIILNREEIIKNKNKIDKLNNIKKDEDYTYIR